MIKFYRQSKEIVNLTSGVSLILKDLQEIVTGRGVERFEAPVVEDEQIDATERTQEPGMAAIAASQSEIGEQPRDTLIEHGTIVAAGLVAERRQLLPTPEGPQISRLEWSSIHLPSTNIVRRLRSRPRGVR